MDILFDLNIILDLLIYERENYDIAEKCDNLIKEKKWQSWIAASSVDNLFYTLLNEAKRLNVSKAAVRKEFEKFMQKINIFSVTGKSVLESIKTKDVEDSIIYTNFKRIAPDGIIISRDEEFQRYSDVISPEDFLVRCKETTSNISTTHQLNHSPPKTIPLLDLRAEYRHMLEDIDHTILKTVAEARYIFGPPVKELEEKIAKYVSVKHCIGISSGTDALVLSLRALAIKLKGQEYFERTDEILTTPFTFTATGDAILRAGATPVFVDIDPATYNIDIEKVRSYLSTSNTQRLNNLTTVVGMLPVHLYGQSCNMDEIMDIANEYNLFVLEDAAQSFGGRWKSKKLGSIGTAGIFSFFPSKNLGGFGDGGMVATNDDEIAELVRMLLRHGGKDKYNVNHIGYNARLDTLQAAILLAKIKYIDEFNERRRQIAEMYTRELAYVKELFLPVNNLTSQPLNHSTAQLPDGHVFHQYAIRTSRRDELQSYLKENGISTMVYYPFPLHKMKVFEGRMKTCGRVLNAEQFTKEVLSLPIEPLQSKEETNYVIDCIKGFFR